ncbi:MAG: hypothetical protein ACLVCH_13315 [Roseburia inulinivorans]
MERQESNSVIRQKIHFYADSRRIEFETYVGTGKSIRHC